MKPIFSARPRSSLAGVLALWLWVFSVQGGGTVTQMTQAALQQALNGGGTVTFAASGTITLTNTITIALASTIDSAGYGVTISGSNAVRLFKVNTNINFTLKGLNLIDGRNVGTNGTNGSIPGAGGDGMGAAILNMGGNVVLNDCILSNHFAQGGVGGTATSGTNAALGGRGLGAAVCSFYGSVKMTNSVLVLCKTSGGQGSPSTGDAGSALGGALYLQGAMANLQNTTFLTNSSIGGIPYVGMAGISKGGDGGGGGAFATNTVLTMDNCVFRGNFAMSGMTNSGYPYVSSKGPGVAQGGALVSAQGSTVTLRKSSFDANKAAGAGAARYELAAEAKGGAVYSTANLQISDCTFENCESAGGTSKELPAAGRGGAVWSSGTMGVNGSLFSKNRAIGGRSYAYPSTATPATGEGGAVWSSGVLNATNCTWTTNFATSGSCDAMYPATDGKGGAGGAVFCSGGAANLVHVTMSGDSVEAGFKHTPSIPPRGAGIAVDGGSVLLRNSIVANSTNTLVWGTVTDGGYNVCSDGTAAFTNTGSLNNTLPLLHALADNGGSTKTMSLYMGSPCLDAIPAGFVSLDQRGVARPQGTAADIGAVENLPADVANDPPDIFTQPSSVVVTPGASTGFAVLAAGAPITYQWWHNSEPVSGATGSNYPIESALAGAQGSYFVVLSNNAGVLTSAVVTLSFDASALDIIRQPVSTNVMAGSPVTFNVLVSGVPPFAYQWRKNGTPIADATESKYTLNTAGMNDVGAYNVVVANGYRSLTSAPAQLVVASAVPVITVEPSSVLISPGAVTSFSVVASGPSLTYQWWHNDSPVIGASSSTYAIESAMAGAQGGYYVVVSNFAGAVTSAVATLTFNSSALNILMQPKSLAVAPGAPASFNVLASGIPTLTYQWLHNGFVIPDATGSSFTIPSVQSGDGGEYSVIVMNDYKTLTSAPALLARGTSNPPLLSISEGGTNLFLTYAGSAGSNYRLLSSCDMMSWSCVVTNVAAGSGAQEFVIPVTAPAAFYRVISP